MSGGAYSKKDKPTRRSRQMQLEDARPGRPSAIPLALTSVDGAHILIRQTKVDSHSHRHLAVIPESC